PSCHVPLPPLSYYHTQTHLSFLTNESGGHTMAENYRPDFPIEQRLDQAARNWNSLFFAILDYLREQDMSPKDFVQWLGERYAPGWEEARGDLHQIAYFAALNPVSLGGQLRRYEVGDDEAVVQTTIGHLSDEGDDV